MRAAAAVPPARAGRHRQVVFDTDESRTAADHRRVGRPRRSRRQPVADVRAVRQPARQRHHRPHGRHEAAAAPPDRARDAGRRDVPDARRDRRPRLRRPRRSARRCPARTRRCERCATSTTSPRPSRSASSTPRSSSSTPSRRERRRVDALSRCCARGGLVAIPTETVYGLAADAANADGRAPDLRGQGPAGRPSADRPPRRRGATRRLGGDHPAAAAAAWRTPAGPGRSRCWCPARRSVLDDVTGGRSTVGLRVPAHPLTLELLERFGGGLAAPSANRFGAVSPTTADHVPCRPRQRRRLRARRRPVPGRRRVDDRRLHRRPAAGPAPGGIPTEDIAALLHDALAERERQRAGSGHARLALRPAMQGDARREPQDAERWQPIGPASRSSTTTTSPATPARSTAACAMPTIAASTR